MRRLAEYRVVSMNITITAEPDGSQQLLKLLAPWTAVMLA
jgi:hypothetical protein